MLGGLLLIVVGIATQRPGDPALYGPTAPGPPVTVYVSYNFFHSDLSVPTALLTQGGGASAAAVARLAPAPWTSIGWGDAAFYQGRGFGPERLLDLARAAVWPSNPAVVHMSGEQDPTAPTPGWSTLRLTLSAEGARRLRGRLDRSLALQDGKPVAIGEGASDARGQAELFFQSAESANLFHVCNHWTGELLNAAGAPITPVLDLTTAGLAADLRWRAHAEPVRANR